MKKLALIVLLLMLPAVVYAVEPFTFVHISDTHITASGHFLDNLKNIAAEVNARMENIGARRLHTVMERLLDDLAFEAPELGERTIPITAAYVRERLQEILKDEDLSQYVL